MNNRTKIGAAPQGARPLDTVLTFLQLNFRKSEMTWILCSQELLDRRMSPDVVLIQDPPSSVMRGKNIFRGYRAICAPGRGEGLGQVAILIKNSLKFRRLRPFGPRVVAVEVISTDGPFIVLSAYLRHSSGEGLGDLEAAIRWAKGRCPRVLLGLDANGHSPWWGPSSVRTNPVGAMLEELIVTLDLEVLNDRTAPASFVSDMGDHTWIDVTLASRSLAASIVNWKVESDFFTGSDHRPIQFGMDSTPLRTEVFKCKDWSNVQWDTFSMVVAQGCQEEGLSGQMIVDDNGNLMNGMSVEEQVTRLTKVLQSAIENHVPERTICWASKPWWSPAVEESRRHMRRLLHRAERLGTAHDWGLYRRARRVFTSTVKRAKAQAWRDFCASVNKADMWSQVKQILKPHQRLQVANLHSELGEWASEDSEKAQVLAQRFFPPKVETEAFRMQTIDRRSEVDSWLMEDWGEFPPVTTHEVHRKITEMRALAAPGPDGIVIRCLQETSSSVVPILCCIYQRLLQDGTHPSMWRIAKVLPIPKPGADPHAAKGYRPIALLSVLSKVLEGLIKDRLSFLLESQQGLSDCQQGFRQARSTELALWRFVTSASGALKNRQRCVAVALDIQSAYDTVDHSALLWKLKAKDVPRYMVAWIKAFLTNRKANLVVNESYFPFDVLTGVPQGSPLSPTLFLIFVDDLLHRLQRRVRVQAYADDILLWDIVTSRVSNPALVQQALRDVEMWSTEWGLSFNPSKCQAIDITNMRGMDALQLRMHGTILTQVKEFKYLGVWVDASLKWERQIWESYRACMTRLHAIRRLCATYWGLHPQVVAGLVKAIVFPRLFYGVSAWGGVVRFSRQLRPIDRVLRLSALMTLGLLRTTSEAKALAICGWLPADLEVRLALVQFILRQRTYGYEDLLETDFTLGVNSTISAVDIARREVQSFRSSDTLNNASWSRLDTLCFGVHAPWDPVNPLCTRLLSRDSAKSDLEEARRHCPGTWIFTDGSIHERGCGAAAIFDDANGPFGIGTHLETLGPLQSSTDAELAGIRLALDQLTLRTDWERAFIVTDSQAAVAQIGGTRWHRSRSSVVAVQQKARALCRSGRQVEFWWAPGHSGIEGNERADEMAKLAASTPCIGTEVYQVSRSMIEGALRRWYQSQVLAQEQAMRGLVLESTEDVIIHTDLRWTRLMPTRFMAAQVGQFLTGHFPTGEYLFRFGFVTSPLCTYCEIRDSREHMLLECPQWAHHRQRLTGWLHEMEGETSREGETTPSWTWDFLVGSVRGRLWLGRFLVAVRPRWRMQDQLRPNNDEDSAEDDGPIRV